MFRYRYNPRGLDSNSAHDRLEDLHRGPGRVRPASKEEMHRQKKPVGTGALLLILLSAGPPFLAAQTQPVTRTSFESSAPEGYTAVTLTTGGRVWGVPARYTSDSDPGTVAYMLLGELKGCDFANAEAGRQSKVYIKTQPLGTLNDYESKTVCRKTSSQWLTSWPGVRITHLFFFDESSPSNTREATYNETTEEYSIDTSTHFSPLSFPEGTFTTRSVEENSFAGINVGSPVSAVGSGSLTYTMSGADADSFSILAGTGQIRTKEGVTYDYETTDRYSVTVGAQDGSGNTDTIAVAIEIVDLGPSCMAPPDFRPIAGDRSVTVSWTPLEDIAGRARVQGYQVEMRQGSNGIWGTTRTLLGREVTGTVYSDPVNATPYQFRIRPLQAEGDCEWHESEIVTPQLSQQAPQDPDEHFKRVGRRPVGTPDRNYRFLSPDRCRHTTGGSTLDATCRYANTGPSSGTITLEFDDPSQAGCEVSLAYSSLTSGSFHDECLGAGVRVAVDFDTSFRLPPLPEGEEQAIPRAPRSQEEFDVLAWGREDLIPGLGFSCLPGGIADCEFTPGNAYRFRRDPDTRVRTYIPGSYSYEKTGPAQGVLTFEGDDGKTFVFTLDVQPSGRMQVTVADADGNSPGWPGMPDTLLEGSSLPILLPIPPSWSAAIEIETDVAPKDWDELEDRIPTPASPADPDCPRCDIAAERLLLGDVWDRAFTGADGSRSSPLAWTPVYRKLGRNRAVWTISFSWCGEVCGSEDNISEFQRALEGSTWVFDISFLTEDSGTIEVTIKQEGESLITLDNFFLDLKAGSSSTDSFPNELTLPDEAPQASGQDITEVQIAPVTSAAGIGQNDIQTFLVNNVGSQPASYSPGDWLEPKDGGNQRMMVVASSQAATAGPASQARPSKPLAPAIPTALGRLAELRSYQPAGSLPPRQQSMNPALTQISVVCMQLERDVPLRGARYFSQPETAEGDVQTCQKNCATEGGDAIQRCVWDCETNPSGDPYTPLESWTVSDGRVQFFFFSAGQCVNLDNTTLNGVTYTIHSSKWQKRADANNAWTDISGTEHTGGVCSYSPSEPGQYRGVAEISIDGERGKYATKNILTVEGEQVDSQPAQQLAPLNQAAFNELVLNKRIATDIPNYHVDFTAAGRFQETQGSNVWSGTYTYVNTGTDTGTLTLNYNDGDRCTSNLTFASPTAGTVSFRCDDGSSGSTNWRLTDIP